MNIGKLRLDGNLILAPMSDVTNLPFRLLCKKYGASLVYSEMKCSEAIVRQNQKSTARCFICKDERPSGIQLLGSDPVILVNSALILQEIFNPDVFDMNLGCPAQSVIKNGFGSALLEKHELIREIIKQLRDSLNVPLTAKIRILNRFEETLKIARIIENAGADAITVHGRTQKQGYSGKSNLEVIKGIKSELSIPVIANGDIVDEKTAKHVLEYTQCDGLMIGRAAIGNPYIFRRLKHYMDHGELLSQQTTEERLDDFFEYEATCRRYGLFSFRDLNVKAMWFTKGMKNIKPTRMEINQTKDIGSLLEIMHGLKVTNINHTL
ncbi:MAG: tRNA-dihydrouridine synthase family protein [Candidatus Methanoperedens sp.]|nr:tRNA-dihydrouridine synthase family protein [Candidatus Methanoperedens sp.]